jgi:hypothetical protein
MNDDMSDQEFLDFLGDILISDPDGFDEYWENLSNREKIVFRNMVDRGLKERHGELLLQILDRINDKN